MFNLLSLIFLVTLHSHLGHLEYWRDGRVVDYSSLENYRTERYRGFESLSLRSNKLKPADFQRVLFFSSLEVPFEVPFFFYESLT